MLGHKSAVNNQSAKGTEMTDSMRTSSKKKKILICIKPLQEERLTALWTGLSERLTKR